MLERLQQLVADAAQLNSKLVLVVANSGGGNRILNGYGIKEKNSAIPTIMKKIS